jgi:hypothetical protein
MWVFGLDCDGCGDSAVLYTVRSGSVPAGIGLGSVCFRVLSDLREDAKRLRWERVDSPDDGEQWFCPTCRLARDREALVAAAGGDGREVAP